MILINLASTSGGAGRTSLAASLATQLHALGRTVMLMQADPMNNLGFHLGQTQAATTGLCQHLLQGVALDTCLQHTGNGLPVLPFGPSSHAEQLALQRLLLEKPDRLQDVFRDDTVGKHGIVLVDLPKWPSAWCKAFFDLGDLNLLALVPDLGAVLGIDDLLPELLNARGASYFLMNRFDSTKVLHLDVWTLCKTKLSHRLLPFYLHEDQSMPESQAAGSVLSEYAPYAQLVDDLNKLALWIDGEIQ
ncbi:MAG TPA: cellulose biosynthesis protein BcsQ [Limnobacter sp.]|nr:cellulose biosynthesis protein BcsQ [Limnobacter sp.]